MSTLDWVVLCSYFLLMLGMGIWARTKVKTASDFFTAGGAMPWWLSGISHHMSGYSSAVFVAYAGIAYTIGFSMYVWWAFSIATALLIGANIFPPRWSKMRERLHIISPLEYLVARYNLPTQQVLAWSGTALKIFDVGAKWTATAILLNVFAGVPPLWGVLLTGSVTLSYAVIGGLWADAMTDMSQFVIQLIAGCTMLVAVLRRLGGLSAIATIWSRLPPGHAKPFYGQYTATFTIVYLLVNILSYNGGTWNLAQRFIAAPNARAARKAALLSSALYYVWPLVLLFPMWAAPLILPNLPHPNESYALLTQKLLPPGLIGLVLAGLFAHTMAMTSSDANAISAVIVRDILPALRKDRMRLTDKKQLLAGRICTFCFLVLSMMIALAAGHFGGVIGLIVLWYGALLGPIAIPMLFGMLPWFRAQRLHGSHRVLAGGAIAFGLVKFFAAKIAAMPGDLTTTFTVVGPVLTSLAIYVGVGAVWPAHRPAATALLKTINEDS